MKNNSLLKKTALALAAVTLLLILGSLACGTPKNEGGRLADNIARMYEHDARTSHFLLNTTPIDGEVTGMAFMETSADGRTALAWVGTNAYFVSEKGVDKLASGIDTAEISFDGRVAVWLDGGQLKKYCVDDRSVSVLAEGVSKLVQASISPNSKTMMLTVNYEGDEAETNISLLCNDEGVKEYSRSIICFAVSDDGDIMYYYDPETKGFTVKQGGEEYIISKTLKATTSYNFTRDLKEVTFDDANGVNHLFVLETKKDTELGSGFGYTEKSDVFSISTISYFSYINDIDSFRNGFWTARKNVEEKYYLYSLGYINDKGEIKMLVNDAIKCFALPDQSRAVYLAQDSSLKSIDNKGSEKQLAESVNTFDTTGDGGRIWYTDLSNVLFTVKGTGKAEKVKSGITSFAALGDTCAMITTDGRLFSTKNSKAEEVSGIEKCVRFDKRVNMLILYTNESLASDDTKVYDAYISADGREFTLAYHGVEP